MLVAALVAVACAGGPEGGDDGDGGAPEMEGTSLLAGAGPERWSLLTVPREGGVARARALDDPSRVVWEGSTRLPPAREIRLLEGPVVLLRTGEGAVHRYDPRSDRLSRVATVEGEADWVGWDRYGVWAQPEGSSLTEVGPEGSWRYELAAAPRWAAPVEEGRVAVLVEDGEGTALWLVGRGEGEPEARARDGFAPPGLVTAWGRRVVLAGDGVVRFFAVPSLDATGDVEVDGPVTAMAASPSSHELYVAVDDPPRLMRVERFGMRAREMTGLPRPARGLRTAVLGEALLVDDGGAPLRVPVGGGDTVRAVGAWREDLPTALPDGRALVLRDGAPALWGLDGGTEPLDAAADRRWAAVRWNPAPPPVVSDRVARSGTDADTAGAEPAPSDTAAAPASDTSGPAADEPAEASPEPGFYAVVTAAREAAGVRRLLERLRDGGYPTSLQPYRDDAGQRWYRGLVGPFEERRGAEAAARQLRRERETSVWVTELRAGATTEQSFP